MKLFYLCFVLFIISFQNLTASLSETDSVKAFKLSESILLDGKLSEHVWNNTPVNQFYQRDPSEGEPATENTRVWVAYDDSYLYIAARLFDSNPDQIDQSLVRREARNPNT